MENETALTKSASELMPIPVSEIKNQIQAIQQMMKDVMKEGMDGHYGKVPGCGDKKVLLKAGAEKLVLLFRFAPTYEVKTESFPDNPGHREYSVKCILTNINTGKVWAEGLGSCSTMESKYRYRDDSKLIETGNLVPKTYWESRDIKEIGGPGHVAKKDESGRWMIYIKESSGKIENPDIADTYNTVLKMAKKRALVDAVITATATSDIFTQDLDENYQVETTAKPEPKAPPEHQAPQVSDANYEPIPPSETVKLPTPKPANPLTPEEKQELDFMCAILAKDEKMSVKDWKNANIKGIPVEIAVETVNRLYNERNKKFAGVTE
ncbi:MAG: hypothetical protein KBA43_08580 [Paludibacteraceae bacterium]|nr:hypothetical protein [Paludibacteraceae bacterium]